MAKKKNNRDDLNLDDYYPVTCYINRDIYNEFTEEYSDKIYEISSIRMNRNADNKIKLYYTWTTRKLE